MVESVWIFWVGFLAGAVPFAMLWCSAEKSVRFWRDSYLRLWNEIDDRIDNNE